MTLMLHAGANALDYADLRQLETPDPTLTHVPIPHHRLVGVVRLTLCFYDHTVEEERHGVTPDGMRYFGVLSLRSTYPTAHGLSWLPASRRPGQGLQRA